MVLEVWKRRRLLVHLSWVRVRVLGPPRTYGIDPGQQELRDAAHNLRHGHLLAEKKVCEVRSLHVLLQVHLVLDLLHFLVNQLFSLEIKKKK